MDHSRTFNTELMEVVELGNLLDCAEATIAGALARKESRGGHYRTDFEKRDDVNFLRHTLAYRTETGWRSPSLRYKPVDDHRIPAERAQVLARDAAASARST